MAQDASNTNSQPSPGKSVNLTISHASFDSVLSVLENSDPAINVVVLSDPNQPFENNKVSLNLDSKSIPESLSLLAQAAGVTMWQKDGVYYIGPESRKPAAPTPQPLAQLPAPRAQFKLAKVQLKYTRPAEILRMLGINRTGEHDLLDIIRQQGIRQMVHSDVNKPYPMANNAPVFMNRDGGATQVRPSAMTPSYNGFTTGSASGLSLGAGQDQGAHRSDSLGTDQEFGRGQFFGGGGQGGFPGAGGQGGFGGGQGGAPGAGGQGGVGGGQGGFPGAGGQGGVGGGNQNAANLLPPGIDPGDISAIDADGSLLVRYTNPLALEEFKKLVALLDVKPKQILITAQFVTVSSNDIKSFGINWNFTKVNLVAGANVGYSTTNTAFLQYAIGNLQTQLSWILTTGHGKLITSPTASTLNGITATFQQLTEEPVLLQTPIVSQNGTVVITTTITIIPVTVGLFVTPFINQDGSITLLGQVISSGVEQTITNPAGGGIPVIGTQQAVITRIVNDGETMVISGLTQSQTSVSENKVPLLGDLPLIGTLFRSRNVTSNTSDLLVFITPKIIPDKPPINSVITGGGAGQSGGGSGPGLLP